MDAFVKLCTGIRSLIITIGAGVVAVFAFLLLWKRADTSKTLTPDIKITDVTDNQKLDHGNQDQTNSNIAGIQANTKKYLQGDGK